MEMKPVTDDSANDINPWPYLNPFFEYSSRSGNSLRYICQLCKPKTTEIASYVNSPSNLGKHVKTVHGPQQYEEYQNLTSRARKRKCTNSNPLALCASKQRKVTSIESPGRLWQNNIDYLLMSFLTKNLLPLQVVETTEFKQLVTALQPNAQILNRLILRQRIDQLSDLMRLKIMDTMAEVQYIATATTCWSVGQHRYVGVTAHWIDSISMQRRTATLAFRRLNIPHSYATVMNAIDDIHGAFNIGDKVISTTAGNNNDQQDLGQITSLNGNYNNGFHEYFQHVDGDETDIQLTNTFEMLISGTNTGYQLPVYQLCACHVLHAIVTKDSLVAEENDTFQMLSRESFKKLRIFWSKLEQCTTGVETVETVCGLTLIQPNKARWSSMFNAIEGIAGIRRRHGETMLKSIFNSLQAEMLTKEEQDFIEDYCTVMKPVAKAMGMLQSEKNAYMGWLLPTINELLHKLEGAQNSSVYCKPLASAMISGIQNRFNMVMVDPLLISAAILHPKFKTEWTTNNTIIQTGLLYLSQKLEATSSTAIKSGAEEDDDNFFSSLNTRNQSVSDKPSELASYLATESRDLSMLHSFPNIKNLFILLNTSMPTSAASDRLLSTEEHMFTSRQADMGSKDFENRLLLKMNWKYCE